MAGLILSPALANQNWGNLLLATAENLAECNGVNDLLHDTTRLPGATPTAALLAQGFSQADADLIVPAFAEVAAVWKFSTNAQAVAMTDFWFHARQMFGTKRMPK
jgi:hypothetical protein